MFIESEVVMLYLKCKRGISMCHVRPHKPTVEDPDVFKREGSVMLEAGHSYPLVEVPNPFDPDAGAKWLALADPSKNLDPTLFEPGDMLGLNKFSLVFGPKSLFEIIETASPRQSSVPALLRS